MARLPPPQAEVLMAGAPVVLLPVFSTITVSIIFLLALKLDRALGTRQQQPS